MKTRNTIFRLLALAAVVLAMDAPEVCAQEQSTATLSRRTNNGLANGRRKNAEESAPGITQRMQNSYDPDAETTSDADRQWMRVVYREIDLDMDKNAPLYFPEDIVDGQENLFRIIMRLLANGQIKAYEYLDGRESFDDENLVKVGDLLDRFSIMHTDAKGSTAKSPRYSIHPSDVPTNEVLSYYIIEQWEFDTRSNKTRTKVVAICPVLHRMGDFGGDVVRYPMFWIKYSDLRPWLAQQQIFLDDDNNLPTATYDDYFVMNLYEGDIYKTRNLRNRSMTQLYPDPDERKAAQDSIQKRLENYDKKLWVPDREEVIAKASKGKKNAEVSSAESADGADVNAESAASEEKASRRTTKRTTKKSQPKQSKVKETKVKSNSSSNATRSVRRRK